MSKSHKIKEEYHVRDLTIDDQFDIIGPDASIVDAAKKMRQKGIPDLVVIDPNSEEVLGVIGDFDIVQNIVAENKNNESSKVRQALYTIKPVDLNTPVSEAFKRMRDLNVNVVPVVDHGKFKGVVSIQDCWSYIPDERVDTVGLIKVANPKYAEFWMASVCAIIAFILTVLLPIADIYGFFVGSPDQVKDLFNLADITGGPITFFLFEATGSHFNGFFTTLINSEGPIWVFIVINSVLVLISGAVGLFSLFYASYSDMRNVRTGKVVRTVLPLLFVIFNMTEWIFLSIGLSTIEVTVSSLGLALSILSMVLVLVAIFRNYFFRQDLRYLEQGNGQEVAN